MSSLTWKRQPELFKFDSRRHRCKASKAKPPAYDGPLAAKVITPVSRQKSRFCERKVSIKLGMLPQTNLLKCMRSSWQFPFKRGYGREFVDNQIIVGLIIVIVVNVIRKWRRENVVKILYRMVLVLDYDPALMVVHKILLEWQAVVVLSPDSREIFAGGSFGYF